MIKNPFRKLVSGKRNRLDHSRYDLDISYITDRVLAMSFPASSKVEKMYRNNIVSVADYLDEAHPGRAYWIYNLSNRRVETQHFHHRVLAFEWEDHHSPQLLVLFQCCEHIFNFLNEDVRNVAILHCNAGKGRTGTAISCYLLFSSLADNFLHAMVFYGWRRFRNGRGVTQPAQQRYVQYFEKAFKQEVRSPSLKLLQGIIVHKLPSNTGQIIEPCVEILDGKNFQVIWSDHPKHRKDKQGSKVTISYSVKQHARMMLHIGDENQGVDICGDVFFRIINAKNNKLICRFAINTSFIKPGQQKYVLKRTAVDPDSIALNPAFDPNFQIQLNFEDRCKTCSPANPVDALCASCRQKMPEQTKEWKQIEIIIQKHKERLAQIKQMYRERKRQLIQ